MGYSPAAVAEALRQGQERHNQEMERLRQELEKLREKSAALSRQISAAEAKAQSTDVLVHTLTARILEWVNQRAGAVKALAERDTRAESELRSELERLHAVLTHLQESQSRFGNELSSLMRRFRDEVVSLRVGLPSSSPANSALSEVAAGPRTQMPSLPGERKESAIR